MRLQRTLQPSRLDGTNMRFSQPNIIRHHQRRATRTPLNVSIKKLARIRSLAKNFLRNRNFGEHIVPSVINFDQPVSHSPSRTYPCLISLHVPNSAAVHTQPTSTGPQRLPESSRCLYAVGSTPWWTDTASPRRFKVYSSKPRYASTRAETSRTSTRALATAKQVSMRPRNLRVRQLVGYVRHLASKGVAPAPPCLV